VFDISERRVCRALEQPRSTQRYKLHKRSDEEILTLRLVELASQYGRYGYPSHHGIVTTRRLEREPQARGTLMEVIEPDGRKSA